ncbi:hypothetical protein ACTA71_008905 [Dictyostelium dimigraforme]
MLFVVSGDSTSIMNAPKDCLYTNGCFVDSCNPEGGSCIDESIDSHVTCRQLDCGGYLLSTNAITQVSELVFSQTIPQAVKSLAIQLISILLEISSKIWEAFT